MARRSPIGGAHEASHGGTDIGPEDALSALSQISQERLPASAAAVPARAAIAAQVKGSRNSAEQEGRTLLPDVIEVPTFSVYASGKSGVSPLGVTCPSKGRFSEAHVRRLARAGLGKGGEHPEETRRENRDPELVESVSKDPAR